MENHTLNPSLVQSAQRQEEDDIIDLVELFYLLWGHAWQILACMLLGAAIAFGVTKFLITPQYEATSSIYIVSASNNSVVNLTDLQIGAQLTADYQELLLSRPLLEDVIANLDLKDAENQKAMTVAALRDMIEVTNTADTRIPKIKVTSPDPQQSADIANELVDQACIYLPQIMETEEPHLVEEAIPPESKASPSYPKNVLLGGVVGAALWGTILILGYLMNDTFMTPDDVERYLGIQPLATIPEGDLGEFNQDQKKRSLLKGKKAK